jgi:uncharacterized Zn-finger protein
MLNCQYCNKKYSTKPHLTRHQKTAKKCIIIQDVLAVNTFSCKGCSLSFTRENILTTHYKTCIDYSEAVLSEEYEEKLFEIEEQLEVKNNTIKDIIKTKDNIIKDKNETIKELKDRKMILLKN